jgi:hypothetical protein
MGSKKIECHVINSLTFKFELIYSFKQYSHRINNEIRKKERKVIF